VSSDRDAQRQGGEGDVSAPAVASREDDLLNAWDRLLAIAALYPAQNTRFHDAVTEWREALRAVARADGSVCIEVGREERLAHEGRVQPPERVARSRLYSLLTGIGVEHVVLTINIGVEALHRLLAVLRETQQAAERSIGFQRAELPELPAGVTVKLRSFGSPGEAGLGAAGAGGAATAASGPSTELPEVNNPHVGVQSDLARSIEERLTVQATSLYRSLTQGAVPETLSAATPSESASDGSGERARPGGAPALPFDAEQLRARLARLEVGLPFDTDLLGPSQPEWLALLVQLALADGDDPTALHARAELARSLERELGLQEIQILVAAAESLLTARDAERVDARLPLLLDPLAGRGQQLQAMLTALVEGVDAERRELLWPHLADALLREAVAPSLALLKGADGATALALPAAAIPGALARLEARPALQAGRISPAVFRPLRAEMRPLLFVLLQSSRGVAAGGQLRAALLEAAPPAPFAGLLALLGDFKPSQREFYRLLLGAGEESGPTLGREAAALALHTLQRLPSSERRRPEVGDALLALTAAPPGEADALLAALLAERRFFFLPAWPAAARRQAQQVQLHRRLGRSGPAKGEEWRA